MINVKTAKSPENTTIAVAMSGGVDSSATAALLKEAGYKVFGITLKLFDGKKSDQAVEDAQYVATQLGIELHILDASKEFKEIVIDDFVNAYSRGETPLPCARCNKNIKFGQLLDLAKELGADYVATGHYVKKEINDAGIAELCRASDLKKDQSYFLFSLTQEQINMALFPLCDWEKEKTRAEAARFGLKIAHKPDSQDICFVPNLKYAETVIEHNPNAAKVGKIVDMQGNILGKHKGIIYYTIGQRRGLGIGGGHSQGNSPLFVIDIKADTNEVVVGEYENLSKNKVYIKDTNWLIDIPEDGIKGTVRLRASQSPQEAKIYKDHVILENPSYGVANGQACVCYIGNRVIGGGWICSSERI